MTAAPWPSLVTCRKSPRLRSPPVAQPRPLVQICPCLTNVSLTSAVVYVGAELLASRLCPICTDHSAFRRLPAPNRVHVPEPLAHVPCSLVELVWYQAPS